ncbi:DUF6037 family protein [Variovorax sp. YR752]|uniref:DUF6037 family protein n=1 Tax=Variovorax sp. YR752 TaxID=1884383 RepID=UPI00211D13A6|nr:DUF6037 family protein [Variovorax sp. YR752]
MGVILNGLGPLVQQMRQRGLQRIRWPYRHSRVSFDVFLFTDEMPWCLLFGAKAYNFAFSVPVHRGYDADPGLAQADYRRLCEVLGLKFDPNNKFSPKAFLEEFGRALPATLPNQAEVRPQDVAPYRKDVEESERVYFCGWKDNTLRGESVSQANLHKTRQLLGVAAYERCRDKNISSRWSADAEAAAKFTMPI